MTDYGVSRMPAWVPPGTGFAVENNALPSSKTSAASLLGALAQGFTNTKCPDSAPVSEAPAKTDLNNGPKQWENAQSSNASTAPVMVSAPKSNFKINPVSSAHKGTAKQLALYEKVLSACSHLPKQAATNIARLIAYRECNANEADPLKARDIGDGAGLTAAGITQKYNPEINFKTLTLKTIVDTYYNKYWGANNMDQYAHNPMLLASLFDACVGMGPKDMKKVYARAGGDRATAESLAEARLSLYQEKPNWPKFRRGWENRVNNELLPYAQSLGSVPA